MTSGGVSMRNRRYRTILILSLVLFFLAAIVMTKISQANYIKECIKVTTVKEFSSESIIIKKTCYVNNTLNPNGELTFTWNYENIHEILKVGDKVKIDAGERVLIAEIKNISNIEGDWVFTIKTNSFIDDLLLQRIDGYIVSADIKGPYRNYVVPASSIIVNGGIPTVAVVYSRPKVWGTEYYIHYEIARIHEINKEKCALVGIPMGGEIVSESDGRLFEGTKVIPNVSFD